jgi:hypothetical protein
MKIIPWRCAVLALSWFAWGWLLSEVNKRFDRFTIQQCVSAIAFTASYLIVSVLVLKPITKTMIK